TAVSIDPLSARGEPPRLGANAGMQIAASAHAAKPPAPAAPAPSPSAPPAQTLGAAAPASKPAPAPAPSPSPAALAVQQDGESIRRAALAFLQQQSVGLPGKITVTVAPAFARGLAACTTLVPFMPPGARVWGSTTVGVRCAGARPWTIYLQARVSLEATYYLAAHPIAPGVLLTPADLTTREGDLSNLPRTIVTDASQAVGAVTLAPISAGTPLRQDMLRSATSVTIGQTVRVVASGPGFTISSEGSVMNNASPGQQVRVKTAGGQIISGIVKDGSTVQIQM
ncbi:MAG TPA: flagellar basal body P-ring formation chaperone FlgA, partial [Trinickia sp.]|nr:flagellar basal body P-ring formation chaperone FlgA [Trinickia sp.]